jgi:uncharacterized protein (DUF342 family)
MSKKRIQLKNGVFELTILRDGALILGAIKAGSATKREMAEAMNGAGYEFGLVEEGLNSLEERYPSQLPVALANYEDEAAEVDFHFQRQINPEQFLDFLGGNPMPDYDLSFPVKKGEKLLTVRRAPKAVMRYPDGRKIFLYNLTAKSSSHHAGNNSSTGSNGEDLVADSDGFAHHSIYGIVNVYEREEFRGLGRQHGEVESEKAVYVSRDVQNGASIRTPSNIKVNGQVKSALIWAEGNVHAEFGMENSARADKAEIYAGQSIYTSMIRQYKVWAGEYLLVRNVIERSQVQCMGTVVSGTVTQSVVRVANKMYVRDVINYSTIYLGHEFVENRELNHLQNYYRQHHKRLEDIENLIIEEKTNIEHTRSNAVNQIRKLQRIAKRDLTNDVMLIRYYNLLESGIKRIGDKIENFRQTMELLRRERMEISFYLRQLQRFDQPTLYVSGKLESGTVIYFRNQKFEIDQAHHGVKVTVNLQTEKLEIQKLT